MFSLLCTVFNVLCAVNNVLCNVFNLLFTVFSVLCIVFSVLCAVNNVLYTVFSVKYIVNWNLQRALLGLNIELQDEEQGKDHLTYCVALMVVCSMIDSLRE